MRLLLRSDLKQVFTRSECQVTKLTTSHCTITVCLGQKRRVVLKGTGAKVSPPDEVGNTRASVQSPLVARLRESSLKKNLRNREKEATFFMAKSVMRITLKAYEHELVDASAAKIIETAKKNGSKVSGPVPLPTKKEVVTILRATHKYKDSREQFEQRTHKRLIDISAPTPGTIESLQRLEMPAGVFIDLKMLNK